MANRVVTRTYRARICNHSQVREDLDSLGFAASKLRNVGRWTVERVWDAYGQIPGATALMAYLKVGPAERTIEPVQQVRAVYENGIWRLHVVCRVDIEDPEPPGDGVAGIDLGICNVAAGSYGDEAVLYPGGALKEDEYYFAKESAATDDATSRKATRLDRKRAARRRHFLHTLSKDIISECVKRDVGTIVVGNLGRIRTDENGQPRNWGRQGNLALHGWAFDRLTTMLEYKAEAEGIEGVTTSERGASKTCPACDRVADSQRVERGLYVCECGYVGNADCNGAENSRREVLPNLASDGGDKDTG